MPSDTVPTERAAPHAHTRLPRDVESWLRCPKYGGELHAQEAGAGAYPFLECVTERGTARYPVLNGIPVLIDETDSVFTIGEFTAQQATFFVPRSGIEHLLDRWLPDVSKNFLSKRNYALFAERLLAKNPTPTVLVLGGSIIGDGMEVLLSYPGIRLIESDVAFGPRTALICDAHDIPFEDGCFDAVIVQAVLEHVADPNRCVAEIHRVLNDGGFVYAETPFMQQVHGGRYDFTRFTLLGHRRLFHAFDEVASGAVCGPGMALAWSLLYFLLSFTTTKFARKVVRLIARLLFFPLPYVDLYLLDKTAALDAASGFYFMGTRANTVHSDRELIGGYRGGI